MLPKPCPAAPSQAAFAQCSCAYRNGAVIAPAQRRQSLPSYRLARHNKTAQGHESPKPQELPLQLIAAQTGEFVHAEYADGYTRSVKTILGERMVGHSRKCMLPGGRKPYCPGPLERLTAYVRAVTFVGLKRHDIAGRTT